VVTFGGLDVVDDFPQLIPVLQRELEVIETYSARYWTTRWDGPNSTRKELLASIPLAAKMTAAIAGCST
jgi:hypothetical protein